MAGAPSFGQTLAVAAVLHVGLFVLAGRAWTPRFAAALAPTPLSFVTVETVSDVLPPPPSPRELPESEPSSSLVAREPITSRRSPTTTAAEPAASAIALPPSTPEGSAWTLPLAQHGATRDTAPGEPLRALGLDGTNHFLGARETPEAAARAEADRANQAAGEAIRGAIHDRDVELGLGGGGPVVTALEAAVRQSTAPDESQAVLVATADASGAIMSVDVVSASDDPAYRAIADDVLARLRGQKLRVPAGARGLAMRINVASRLAMPSGGGIGLDPRSAGMHFDMSDVGARPHRVIHARVLGEQVL